jgi:hypothetical protein
MREGEPRLLLESAFLGVVGALGARSYWRAQLLMLLLGACNSCNYILLYKLAGYVPPGITSHQRRRAMTRIPWWTRFTAREVDSSASCTDQDDCASHYDWLGWSCRMRRPDCIDCRRPWVSLCTVGSSQRSRTPTYCCWRVWGVHAKSDMAKDEDVNSRSAAD